MRKTLHLELEIDSDFESTIYKAIGDLLSLIEDEGNFTIKDATVIDFSKTTTLPSLQKEMSTSVKRSGGYRPSYGDF